MPKTISRTKKPKDSANRRGLRLRMMLPFKDEDGQPIRLTLSTTVTDIETYKSYMDCLRALKKDSTRREWLRELHAGKIDIATLYARWTAKTEAPKVTDGITHRRIFPHAFEWLAVTDALRPVTIKQVKYMFDKIQHLHPNPTVDDLPGIMLQMRGTLKTDKLYRLFNLRRGYVLSYLKHAFLPEQDPQWMALAGRAEEQQQERRLIAVQDMADRFRRVVKAFDDDTVAKKTRIPNIPTVRDVDAMCAKLSPKYASVVWSCYVSGLRPTEYAGGTHSGARLTVNDGYIEVVGLTKTKSGNRRIPLLPGFEQHHIHPNAFSRQMETASNGKFQPRDLRRGFARLMEEADIKFSRQMAYMGHKPRGMTERYKSGHIDPAVIAADRQKLLEYIESERHA